MSGNWLDNICIKHSHNCRKGDTCGPNSECCWEKPKGNQGTCVATGSCNFTTGHPTNQTSTRCPPENYMEGFSGTSGSTNGNCNNWKWAMILLGFVTFLLGFGFVFVTVRDRKM